MSNPDLLIYAVHGAFWGSFGLTKTFAPHATAGPHPAPAVRAEVEATAPYSRSLLWFHLIAFGVMYFGVGNAVLPNRVPLWFNGQWLVGLAIIALGAAMMCWALLYFRSWRFRAQVTAGHELATGGPFHYVRHPIYLGLDLLAIGIVVWVPTVITALGALLMIVGSDLRGRGEEALLHKAFGEAYTSYCRGTRRFLPGIY